MTDQLNFRDRMPKRTDRGDNELLLVLTELDFEYILYLLFDNNKYKMCLKTFSHY
jgi:hypothetical protein